MSPEGDPEASNSSLPKGTPSIWISEKGTTLTWASAPAPTTWMEQGFLLCGSSHVHSHFEGFKCRPSAGPLVFMRSQACKSCSSVPMMPPSSIVLDSKLLDLVHEAIDAATKVKGAQRVSLLNPSRRLDDVLVVVKQHRRSAVAPLGPVRHLGEHRA